MSQFSKRNEAEESEEDSREDYDSEEEEEESEEEEEEEEMVRPTFVPKSQRVTIMQKNAEEMEEIERENKKKEYEEQRKQKTRSLVAESIINAANMEKEESKNDSDGDIPDCDDATMDYALEVCSVMLL